VTVILDEGYECLTVILDEGYGCLTVILDEGYGCLTVILDEGYGCLTVITIKLRSQTENQVSVRGSCEPLVSSSRFLKQVMVLELNLIALKHVQQKKEALIDLLHIYNNKVIILRTA
jgi:hypothetical protein